MITGGAGFIGYHLAKRLFSEGYQVDLIDNLSRGVMDDELEELISNSNIKFFNRNLCQSDSFNDLDDDYQYIYHLAAIVGVTNVFNKPFSVLRDNATVLFNLLDFAKRQNDFERFIFTSTSEVYAGTLHYFTLAFPTPETSPLTLPDLEQPRSSYMLSKIYGEALCHNSGVPFTIVRPHNIYGPRMGMAHVIPELLKRTHSCKPKDELEVYSPNHRRTFCYVEDGVEMIKRVAETSACLNKTMNIGNQEPEISIKELAEMIIRTTGKNLKVLPKPETLGSPSRRCPDMTKTLEITRYRSKIDLEEGIKLTYRWYKENIFENQKLCAN